ncbi:MAG: hypothetical protein K0S51_57 [Bacillales bacterium]|jgi:hypothetical protein|nr:hypothetical protein [Bacillales bacterium]
MRNFNKLGITLMTFALSATLIACNNDTKSSEDKGNNVESATTDFKNIVNKYPKKIGFHKELNHWGIELDKGEKFEWTKDMSSNAADFAIVTKAEPFISAGLDVNKLGNGWLFKKAEEDTPDLLIRPYDVSDRNKFSSGSSDAMRVILKFKPEVLTKDDTHNIVTLGEGFEVRWAEEIGKTNADFMFRLNSTELVEAGLDLDKLEGTDWKVISEQVNGETIKVLDRMYMLEK